MIANSAVLTVRSQTGEAYQVYVAWPDGTPPPDGWPILYLLDGNDQFPVAVATARRMARMPERSGVSPGIIVGIDAGPLSRRSRDYTPRANLPAGLIRGPGTHHPTGGADAFLTFLTTRIKPVVEGRWPVDPGRQTLAGHSFGGLASLYELHRFGHFTGYAAISPSLWFGGGTVLPDNVRQFDGHRSSPPFWQSALFRALHFLVTPT
ncbi:alpha/beta hydrolase [Sphingobium quisquiliarum]|uniref:alpha/beta hydrolase n=1 Tax=Sphingobium quisquiliarum TaxID=538379 RepID=UPI0003F89E93|nr:alpha/beta hydrolase-fold protein [Sphingobium quisquiliarum]